MNVTTIVLGAAALGFILAVVIKLLRRRDGVADPPASKRSHIFSATVLLLLAACALVDAAVGDSDRYLLIGIGIILVAMSVAVLLNIRNHTTRV